MTCSACGFVHGSTSACPPAELVQQAREYIAAAEADPASDRRDEGNWTFARTMASNPHWYTVRQRSWAVSKERGEGHEALFRLIRDHYYLRSWHRRSYRSVDLDGYSYWIMQDGTVINRKPADAAGWDDDGQGVLF